LTSSRRSFALFALRPPTLSFKKEINKGDTHYVKKVMREITNGTCNFGGKIACSQWELNSRAVGI
jgi:hypothetical protein